MYREEVITNFDQRVGFEGCYCNYLAICHYFLNKKPPVMNNIIYHSYWSFLKSLILVLGLFLYNNNNYYYYEYLL